MSLRAFSISLCSILLFSCGGTTPDGAATGDQPAVSSGGASPSGAPSTAGHAHRRCGWVGPDDAAGVAAFAAHADFFDAVHPDWYAIDSDGVSLRAIAGSDDATLLGAAAAHHVSVMPLVTGVDDPAIVRGMLADPGRRAAHVAALVALAQSKGYDGLDIDYEGLWSDDDRPGFTAFVVELAAAMHSAGKQLSLAVPALDHAPTGGAWSYADLSAVADRLHLMGYDFHSIYTHAGPTAPLGWIDAVAGQAATTGHPEKFLLGLPNYGVTENYFTSLGAAEAQCSSPAVPGADHMLTCSIGNYAAGSSLRCAIPQGELYFDTVQSLEEKVETAVAHKLGGVSYWMVGGELDGFFDMIKKHY